jgi:hypothetical protein
MIARRTTLVMLLVCASSGAAEAQMTHKCTGQTWAEIGSERYGDARLGELLAINNRARGTERCTKGKFVRLLSKVRHQVKLGQTLAAISSRFLRAPGAIELLRQTNNIPKGIEPKPNSVLEIPAEIAIEVGTRPEAELSEIPGMPEIELIRRYNGAKGELRGGGTIYVPLFIEPGKKKVEPEPAVVAPPPPPPPVVEEPPSEAPVETSTSGDVAISYTAEQKVPVIAHVLRVDAVAISSGFVHEDHRLRLADEFRCELCHQSDPRQPASYVPVAVAICAQCHNSVEDERSRLRPLRLPLGFSHALHLKEGVGATCLTCHPPAQAGERRRPDHFECSRCHSKGDVQPKMSECKSCHFEREERDRLTEARVLLDEHLREGDRQSDVRFGHEVHVATLGGEGDEATCAKCHGRMSVLESLDEVEPFRMADCLVCHRGLERELAEQSVSLDRCKTCHVGTRPFSSPSFASTIDKPVSHTVLFRRSHELEASRDRGTCQACHRPLAGGDGQSCNRCHQQMRPRDHGPRWREDPHGRAAIRDPDRCGTCHLQDRCADCHAIRPRDHFPIEAFRLQHNRSARRSLTRCMTCHVPAIDCARCHDVKGS